MAEAIRRKCPSKIDIGPVYTYNPQNRLSLGGEVAPGHINMKINK
jgi:hypothetical protein